MSEDSSTDSRLSSLLSAITSLAATLMPNAIDFNELQRLILNLIQLPTANTEQAQLSDDEEQMGDSRLSTRRERHRQTERIRHNTIVSLIRQLSLLIGHQDRQDSQANILIRSARYVIFLSHVIEKMESADDSIDPSSDEWLQSLYPLYQRAYEEANNLVQNCREEANIMCGSESSQESVDSLNRSRDHCIH